MRRALWRLAPALMALCTRRVTPAAGATEVASSVASLLTLALACALPAALALGCVEGATLTGPLDPDVLGPYDGSVTPDPEDVEDAADVADSDDVDVDTDAPDDVDADVADPDVADPGTGDTDTVDSDAGDTGDEVDTGPCPIGTPGCPPCATDGDCRVAYDDGNACNGTWSCDGGQCVEEPEPVDPALLCVTQNEATPAGVCRAWACEPVTGGCALVATPSGGVCDDGDPCTIGDQCIGGSCEPGERLLCDDGDPCSDDGCGPSGCTYTWTPGELCDDGNPCSVDDVCTTIPGGTAACLGTGEACACTEDAECEGFDDGDLCTGLVRCIDGRCSVAQGTVAPCEQPLDGNPCEVLRCDPALGCVAEVLPDGTGCDDGDRCTVRDVCDFGECVGGDTLDCEGGPCVEASCDAATGCVFVAVDDGAACGQEGTCLEGGSCRGGACVPSYDSEACPCSESSDCEDLEDGDACNGTFACVDGRCALDPETVVVCEAAGPCEAATCDPASGECSVEPVEDDEPCDDLDACTSGDVCVGGVCAGAACGQGSSEALCVTATCNPSTGCQAVAVGAACAGDDACTKAAGCVAGGCQSVSFVVCADGGECFDATCESASGGCAFEATGAACDDGDPCTVGDACVSGQCRGAAVFCDDGEACTDDTCDDGECVFTANALLCDDGNPCTQGSQCEDGACAAAVSACGCGSDDDCVEFDDGDPCNGVLACIGGVCVVDPATVVTCDPAGNTPCTDNVCDPASGGCAIAPRADGGACDDGDPCTVVDICAGGSCVGEALGCDDGNPCTVDGCDPVHGCSAVPAVDGVACDDGNACTTGEACAGGVCSGGSQDCSPCVTDADCVGFDDGDLCTGSVACLGGQCRVDPETVPAPCPVDVTACATWQCQPATGACEAVATGEGEPCEDGNACTAGTVCQAGACVGGETLTCGEGEPCRVGECDPATGACAFVPALGTCDDGNDCTQGDVCQLGECVGSVQACPCAVDDDCSAYQDDLCAADLACGLFGCAPVPGTETICDTDGATACAPTVCNPSSGACESVLLADGAGCDDGSPCTDFDRCDDAGVCAGFEIDCDDASPCTADACDPLTGCVNTPLDNGSPCDDGDECTANSACAGGQCLPIGPSSCFCNSASDCPPSSVCSGEYLCQGVFCIKQPAVFCSPGGNPCKIKTCNESNGACVNTNAPNQSPCDDGNPCTVADRCVSGFCTGDTLSCDDGDPCTEAECDSGLGGCVSSPIDGAPCDDGDPCTVDDTCESGVCVGGSDACGCETDADCAALDDGDFCNGVWGCVDDSCEPLVDSDVVCEDTDPFDCVDPVCNPATGECTPVNRPGGQLCDDGSSCTSGDACVLGACVGAPKVSCPDPAEPCVDNVCNPGTGGCELVIRGPDTPCADGNACTTLDRCLAGLCLGQVVDCDDDDPCTADVCDAGSGCQYATAFGPCDDGDPCTVDDVCTNGVCVGTVLEACGCSTDVDCLPLDDGDLCNGTPVCVDGACVGPGIKVECSDSGSPCAPLVCEPDTGECVVAALAEGALCDDGDACTTFEACAGGDCVGVPIVCDDGLPCSDDACDPEQGCVATYLGTGAPCESETPCGGVGTCEGKACVLDEEADACPCVSDADCAAFEDGDLCNGTLVCVGGLSGAGRCEVNPATVVACALDQTGCSRAACDPTTGVCDVALAPDGTSCNDGDSCTYAGTCSGGVCDSVPLPCHDGDPCTLDSCHPVAGCVHTVTAGACEDGDPCTIGDQCVDGACEAGADNPCDDRQECTIDSCVPAVGCVHTPVKEEEPCGEGDACVVAGACASGVCVKNFAENCACPGGDADCDAEGLNDAPCEGQWACGEAGFCERVPGSVPDCSDTFCGKRSCDALTGECVTVAGSGTQGVPCTDGDLCTDSDTCVDGFCVGELVECKGAGACQRDVCVPQGGCQIVPSAEGCDDGVACTSADRCVAGECLGTPVAPFADAFLDGDAGEWTLSSTGLTATWHITAFEPYLGPFALRAGNPGGAGAADPGGPWEASAQLPLVDLPDDVTGALLTFAVRDAGGAVTLEVTGDAASLPLVCGEAGVKGYAVCTAPLDGLVAGGPVAIALVASAPTGSEADGPGLWVDDVRIDWVCGL